MTKIFNLKFGEILSRLIKPITIYLQGSQVSAKIQPGMTQLLTKTFFFYFNTGGIDTLVENFKKRCEEDAIPYLFSIRRWLLGRILLKKGPVSCVGLLSMEGSETNSKKLMELLQDAREQFVKQRK